MHRRYPTGLRVKTDHIEWGVDFERAVREFAVRVGDAIGLESPERRWVTVLDKPTHRSTSKKKRYSETRGRLRYLR